MKKKRVLLIVALSLAGLILLGALALDVPHWQKLDLSRLEEVRQTSLVFGANGREIGVLEGRENRVSIPLEQVPVQVRNAFIAAEDVRFYRHHGVDLKRIFGALLNDLRTRSFSQGASTITQQLIKLTHLSSEKSLSRKAQEAWLALQLEQALSKEEILEAYLNVAYFGSGAYGIETAAHTFFDKPASELTLTEGALLAGLVKSPSGYAPGKYPEKALSRRNGILSTMAREGMISPEEAESAQNAPLELAQRKEAESASAREWYLDAVLEEACQRLSLPAEDVLSGGFRIQTAYDDEMQAVAEALYQDASRFPAVAADGVPVQSALVALDPETGEILSLIGGREYQVRRGLNRATQMARQPGSAIKPLSTYAAAVELLHYVPTSVLDDTQRTFEDGYAPRNSGDTYNGLVTMREALSRSLNVATVDLAETVGMASVAGFAERFGIPLAKEDKSLSLALGAMTYGVSPAQLAGAYAALANGGTYREPHLIRSIQDSSGRTVYESPGEERRAVSPETAYLLTDMLKTAASSGSARALSALAFPVAAKTGTAGTKGEGNRDAWTVAYTPDLVCCVWMGFDDPDKDHMLKDSEGGGSYPARMAAAFLTSVSPALSGEDFRMPSGLRTAVIDKLTLEDAREAVLVSERTPAGYSEMELFFQNSLPGRVSSLWEAPAPVRDLRLESGEGQTPVLSFTCLDAYADYIVLRSSDGRGEVAAALSGVPGETLRFADVEADLREELEYTVIPRHRLLYEEGSLLAGDVSNVAFYKPGGLLNRFAELFEPAEEEPPAGVQPEKEPSIFG